MKSRIRNDPTHDSYLVCCLLERAEGRGWTRSQVVAGFVIFEHTWLISFWSHPGGFWGGIETAVGKLETDMFDPRLPVCTAKIAKTTNSPLHGLWRTMENMMHFDRSIK